MGASASLAVPLGLDGECGGYTLHGGVPWGLMLVHDISQFPELRGYIITVDRVISKIPFFCLVLAANLLILVLTATVAVSSVRQQLADVAATSRSLFAPNSSSPEEVC